MFPKLFKTKLYSAALANFHLWVDTLGIIMHALPMYVAGFVKKHLWKQFNPDGTLTCVYYLETVNEIIPMYWMLAIGVSIFIVGAFVMLSNMIRTV